MFNLEEISLTNLNRINEVKSFLHHFNLNFENDIDYTIVAFNGNQMIATASKAKNVLKCFAILEEYQGEGIMNSLIKKIEDRMFKESLYHFFIYTPSYNKQKFISVGYKELITSSGITLLENGSRDIKSFLETLKKKHRMDNREKACIIINGNPFTLGHRYLIESCAKENEEVLVFVVTEDKSSFPFDVRFRLISEGCKDLMNVKVLETGPYLISNATFPTYFLKNRNEVLRLQTQLDCEIFSHYYAKIFNIKVRYVGNEPYCEVTCAYNDMMKTLLPQYGITVKELDRVTVHGDIISASKVRKLLAEDHLRGVKHLVPEVTYQYLISDEAQPIIAKLKESDRRH